MGLEVEGVGIGQQARQALDDFLAVLFGNADIDGDGHGDNSFRCSVNINLELFTRTASGRRAPPLGRSDCNHGLLSWRANDRSSEDRRVGTEWSSTGRSRW